MKKTIVIISSAIVLVGAIALGVYVSNSTNVLATVNGEKIEQNQVEQLVMAQHGATALETLITDKMIELEAKEQGITVSEDEMAAEMENYYEMYNGEEAFGAMLSQNGMSIEELEKDVHYYLLTKKLMSPIIEVTEEERETYFEENNEQFNQEEQVEASHILVEDENTANEVKEKLAEGEDFSTLAAEYSTDEASKEEGGQLGYFSKGEMVEPFEEAAFELEVDQISEPVESEHGFHIIKVTGKNEAKEAIFEEHQDEIEDILFNEKFQAEYGPWVNLLREQYNIDYN
ncbi:peptidylprolyl isomerase [Alkalihalobacillus sp. 1P02AB]|uniref:peptidylprolyl isomerase n=1 Tax=Alkalihalobacillus sp. 1P02AB TaxID=3132260 RepID=UPI0039A68812